MFVIHKPFQPSLKFVGKPGACPGAIQFYYTWAGIWPLLQTLAYYTVDYYGDSIITAIKSFLTLAPGGL